MKAGTMFGGLMQYENEEYGKEHAHMEIYTKTEKRQYEVIAVFYSQVYYPADLVFKYIIFSRRRMNWNSTIFMTI